MEASKTLYGSFHDFLEIYFWEFFLQKLFSRKLVFWEYLVFREKLVFLGGSLEKIKKNDDVIVTLKVQ